MSPNDKAGFTSCFVGSWVVAVEEYLCCSCFCSNAPLGSSDNSYLQYEVLLRDEEDAEPLGTTTLLSSASLSDEDPPAGDSVGPPPPPERGSSSSAGDDFQLSGLIHSPQALVAMNELAAGFVLKTRRFSKARQKRGGRFFNERLYEDILAVENFRPSRGWEVTGCDDFTNVYLFDRTTKGTVE